MYRPKELGLVNHDQLFGSKATTVRRIVIAASVAMVYLLVVNSFSLPYPIVDTDVHDFYGTTAKIAAPSSGTPFYGQDAAYAGNQPSYANNGDGTITDNVTGLMWQQDMGAKISWSAAFSKADTMKLGGHTDWRVPTIKELYSLILFTGQSTGIGAIYKYIDTTCFNQPIGNTAIGEREIDAQTWSSTQYTGLTMAGDTTVFGVNFIDGRIKGYPKYKPGTNNAVPATMYFRMVRGNTAYGKNRFVDNKDGTISDSATGLMWQQADDGVARDWEHALSYAESMTLAGHSDWRLPNAKELQSVVDYSRSPSATHSPAIDPLFSTTEIKDPNGNPHYPYFWTGTTHLDGNNPYTPAVYIAFGKALGKMNNTLMDVHGAGAQRSDPKSGDSASYPSYSGPQGDLRAVYNFVRCVRDAGTSVRNAAVGTAAGIGSMLLYDPMTRTLSFPVSHKGQISLKLYNVNGALVATCANGCFDAGKYAVKVPKFTGAFIAVVRMGSESVCRRFCRLN
jgi:hypothetical protein